MYLLAVTQQHQKGKIPQKKTQVDIHYQTETNRARIVRKKLHHDIVDSVSRYRRV